MKFLYALFALSAFVAFPNTYAQDDANSFESSKEVAEAPQAPAMEAADAEKLIREEPTAAGVHAPAKSSSYEVPLADYNSRPWPPD